MRGRCGRYINRRRQRMASKYNIIGIILYLTTPAKHFFFLKIQGSSPQPKGKKFLATIPIIHCSCTPTYVTPADYTRYVHRIFRVTCAVIFFFFHSLFIFFFSPVSWLWNKIRVLIESEPVVYLRFLESSQVNHSSRTVDWRRPQAAVLLLRSLHRTAADCRTIFEQYYHNTHFGGALLSCCRDGPYNIVPWSVAGPYTGLMSRSFVRWKKSHVLFAPAPKI